MVHVLLEVLQNALMGVPPIARVAQRFHSTGLNADREQARKVFDRYARFVPVAGKDILEIGPGHTLEVLGQAMSAGARSAVAVDVVDYAAHARKTNGPVQCRTYDGRALPFESERFDLVWSHTAFEHLRYPAVTVTECYRVLRPGGTLVSLIDLGDHSIYGKPSARPESLFDCLRYPEWLWNLMKWNRSSYTNRLRKSEWIRLFREAGFVLRKEESQISEDIARALPSLPYLHRYSYDDAVTNVVTVCLDKPAAAAGG